MAGTYRKKRRTVGPSKNEEKVERAKQVEAMGRASNQLGSRYPAVKVLKVILEFVGAQQQSLGSETRVYNPQDACDFAVACPGLCGVGSFDLAGKISQIIEAREESSASSGVCQERLHAGAGGLCGASLKCRVEVSYKPTAPQPAA